MASERIESSLGEDEAMIAKGPSRFDRFRIRIKAAIGLNVVLCDSCKWNWRSACHRSERPNATWCPDYSKKGS